MTLRTPHERRGPSQPGWAVVHHLPAFYVLEHGDEFLGVCIWCEQMVFSFDELPASYRDHRCPVHEDPLDR